MMSLYRCDVCIRMVSYLTGRAHPVLRCNARQRIGSREIGRIGHKQRRLLKRKKGRERKEVLPVGIQPREEKGDGKRCRARVFIALVFRSCLAGVPEPIMGRHCTGEIEVGPLLGCRGGE